MQSPVPHFMFGPWKCPWTEAFYLSPLCIGMVNNKPIVPGHCLVIPRRAVDRIHDLTSEELTELWTTTIKLGGTIEKEFKGEAMTYTVQDGVSAGQTVPHAHFHLIPRRKGDFPKNDMVYDKLEKWNWVDADHDNKKPRSAEDMKEEAFRLRKLFDDSLPIPEM